jgi:hypothetical protein
MSLRKNGLFPTNPAGFIINPPPLPSQPLPLMKISLSPFSLFRLSLCAKYVTRAFPRYLRGFRYDGKTSLASLASDLRFAYGIVSGRGFM